jgi:tetratricopeptide (TPR) repeat protein
VTFVLTLLAVRALAWMSVFASVLTATRMLGWKSLETICYKWLPITRSVKIFPGGSVWLATALTQSLVARGQYDKVLTIADEEWTHTGAKPAEAQNLGTLCFTASIADQAKGDLKTALVWNERSLKVLNLMLEQMQNPKKGIMAKVAATQYDKAEGQLRMQLAGAYFNNATMLFNKMEHRKARESYKLAVENAAKAPDFPEKSDIIKAGNEQLGRLKHA